MNEGTVRILGEIAAISCWCRTIGFKRGAFDVSVLATIRAVVLARNEAFATT